MSKDLYSEIRPRLSLWRQHDVVLGTFVVWTMSPFHTMDRTAHGSVHSDDGAVL